MAYRFCYCSVNRTRQYVIKCNKQIKNFLANQKVIQQPPPRPASTPTETQQSVLTSVQQEIAARRKANISRQDSRLSVKCLIESIENATKQAKAGEYNTIL